MTDRTRILQADDTNISEEFLDMILRRFFTLAALALAVSLSLSGRAHAGYDFTTSIASVSGLTLVLSNQTGSFSIPAQTGGGGAGGTVTIQNGQTWSSYTDAAGATIFLVNNQSTNNSYIGFTVPTENIYININSAAAGDVSTWSFTENIKVTNPTATPTQTGTFVEVASYTMGGNPGTGANPTAPATLTTPVTLTIGPNTFNIVNPLANSVAYNNVGNGGVTANINAVPEPASVVMLGGGLAGVTVLGLRRRRRLRVT
jgi:hypothetical protein